MSTIVGKRIRFLRQERRWTQDDLGVLLKVDRTTVGSWEQSRRQPDIASLCLIADLFDVTLDWLVGRSDVAQKVSDTQKTPEKEYPFRTEIQQLAAAFSLKPSLLHEFLKLLSKIHQDK